jgi:hypothetical protein
MYRRPAETPRARLPLLDQVTIKTPCRESWDAMTGDDRVRFCARCSKDVYDLSAMTADEAETFLAMHLDDEDACVRLYRRPDGRVLTSECVQGTRNRHARKVAVGTAAGLCAAFAATVALANVHVPDGRNLPRTHARVDVKRLAVANFDDAATSYHSADDEAVVQALVEIDQAHGFSMGEMTFAPAPPNPRRAQVLETGATVSSGLPIDVVRRIVRQNHGRTRVCYEAGLGFDPSLEGGVAVRFLIARDGSVAMAQDHGSDLPDPKVVACIVRGFSNMSFPAPDPRGPVTVSYRYMMKPHP